MPTQDRICEMDAHCGILGVAPALNSCSGDSPRGGLGECNHQGGDHGKEGAIRPFVIRVPLPIRRSADFLSALIYRAPLFTSPYLSASFLTSLIRPGTGPSEGRWRRHPRPVSLAALLPGVLLYDRLGISHGTLAGRGTQARPSGPSLWNTASEGVFRESRSGIPSATRQPASETWRWQTDWSSLIHGRHSTTLRMHLGTKRCCCQPGPPTRLEQDAS